MWTERLNARIFKRMKIRPMPCKRSLGQGNRSTDTEIRRKLVYCTLLSLGDWFGGYRSKDQLNMLTKEA